MYSLAAIQRPDACFSKGLETFYTHKAFYVNLYVNLYVKTETSCMNLTSTGSYMYLEYVNKTAL